MYPTQTVTKKSWNCRKYEWQQKYNPTVWANVCGTASGVIVIDADNKKCVEELDMGQLKKEIDEILKKDYRLEFEVPTGSVG
ncbi:hypothetical protein ACFLYR_08805 [Chloroflexota bacterium]